MFLQLLLAQLFLVSRAGDRGQGRSPLPGAGIGAPFQVPQVFAWGTPRRVLGGNHEALSARHGRDPVFPPARAKVCEELLRYAVYNCISIDTDRETWDE